jgi:large subunit ribosomal protein L21
MYGYADIKGHQFRVVPGEKIQAPALDLEVGAEYEIAPFFMFNDGQASMFGADCAGVKAKSIVEEHGLDKKIIVFKKKRRKGFKVKNGHRQKYTILRISEIVKTQENG